MSNNLKTSIASFSSTSLLDSNLLPKGWERYRKVRELGQGSYGVVFLAADLTLEPSLLQEQTGNVHSDYYVAVKCVSLAGASESESSNALREVAIIRNLDHPNILRCLDVFVDSHENLCTVTEFIDGGDLSDMISKCNSNHQIRNKDNILHKSLSDKSQNHFSYPQQPDASTSANSSLPSYRQPDHGTTTGNRFYVDAIAVVDIAEQILKGLAYLHAQRILHRDIKPANLFVTSSGVVKIGDFGISRVVQHSMQANLSQQQQNSSSLRTAIGTPFYLSPESLMGCKYSFPSDVWSFGVMMYELYCGVPPFNARNVLALVNIITQGEYDQQRLMARPYRSGLTNVTASSGNVLNATEAAGGISEQVQREVCDAVVNIIKAALVLDPADRPSAKQLLLKFFTEDPDAPINNNGNESSVQNNNNNNNLLSSSSSSCVVPNKIDSSENYASLMKEMESVAKSSGMKIAPNDENNSNNKLTQSASSLHENKSVLLIADTEIFDVPKEENSVIKNQASRIEIDQGYEDDFELDILSSSSVIMKASPEKPTTDIQEQDKNYDTRNLENKIDALPWLAEAQVFENIQIDDVSGHGPLYIIRKDDDDVTTSARRAGRGGSVANCIPNNHDPKEHHLQNIVSPSPARSSPSTSLTQQQPQNYRYLQQHHGQYSDLVCEIATPSRLSFNNNSSSTNNQNNASMNLGTVMIGGIDATNPSLKLHPSLRAGLIAEQQQQNQQNQQLSLHSFKKDNNNQIQDSAAAAALIAKENYEITQKRIRERALIFHKKRLNAIAKEREAYLKDQQHHQQENDFPVSKFQIPSSVPPLGGFAKPISMDPMNLHNNNNSDYQQPPLLRRPSHVLSEIVDARHRGLVSGALLSAFPHLLPRPQSEYKSAKNENNIVNSSLTFNANNTNNSYIPGDSARLVAAANNVMKGETQKTSPLRNGEYDGTTSSDEESSTDSDDDGIVSDDDEEEEEEESDIDDEEFRVKVFFSAETATNLKATEFDLNHFNKKQKKTGSTKQQKTSTNDSSPLSSFAIRKSFPAFTIKFHLFSDDAYSKLLKAVQDRVIFYGEAEKLLFQQQQLGAVASPSTALAAGGRANSENYDTTTSGVKKTTKKSKSSNLSATNFLLASTSNGNLLGGSLTVSTQCVPLSFEYADGTDKLVFDRKADWNCVRENHLDCKGMDSVMHLNAIPRN